MTDEELIKIVRTSDQEQYSEIVKKYQEKLFRYASNIVIDESRAMDIVQQTFIKAFVNLNSFDTRMSFSSWVYRIAHNEAMNLVKKYKKEISLLPEFEIQSTDNIEDDYFKKETVKNVRKCLNDIPVLYSEPLSLYYLEEKSYEEISDILRLPTNTIGTRISRAKGLMKKICKKNK
ncbi:MAG: sigma-70 family RNA polymerase sigma factor [Microgenomates group bacterium]